MSLFGWSVVIVIGLFLSFALIYVGTRIKWIETGYQGKNGYYHQGEEKND
jgi:hypothetical protein